MGAQHQAFGAFCAKVLHDSAPQQPCCPHFGDLKVEIHTYRPKKR